MISSRMDELTSFIVMDVLEKAHEMEQGGTDIIHLEVGEPDFDTPECIKSSVRHALADNQTHYTHSLGLPALRIAICEYYQDNYGVNIDPDQVDNWYLGIYIDAIEWVEMPNTRGMSQFADGGLIATKPYAASGSYINKMSDYCGDCHYSVKERTSEKACPFNSLYWHFMQRHGDKFSRNPRTAMAYRSWGKMDEDIRRQLLERGEYCLENLEDL